MKRILDACCGSRMFWFDFDQPDVTFLDIRNGEFYDPDGRITYIRPDIVGDFRQMPFADNSFCHVIFDPPHLISSKGENTCEHPLQTRYGSLNRKTFINDLILGLKECHRVLKENGTLVFKWSEHDVKINRLQKEVFPLLPFKPRYGCRTTTSTIWVVFIK